MASSARPHRWPVPYTLSPLPAQLLRPPTGPADPLKRSHSLSRPQPRKPLSVTWSARAERGAGPAAKPAGAKASLCSRLGGRPLPALRSGATRSASPDPAQLLQPAAGQLGGDGLLLDGLTEE